MREYTIRTSNPSILAVRRYRAALAALAVRRQEALARRGRVGAAYVSYMHTTLPHYLHQVRCCQPGQQLNLVFA